MPLFNVDGGYRNACEIEPDSAEHSDYIKALKRRLDPTEFSLILRIVDDILDIIVKDGDGKLTWTKTGAAFGFKSPFADKIVPLWDAVIRGVGDGKECRIAVGCIFRWRIALRDEIWAVATEKRDDIDPDTGKKIKVSQYWIKPDLEIPSLETSLAALKSKWGAESRR
jgi:hypothetical protein